MHPGRWLAVLVSGMAVGCASPPVPPPAAPPAAASSSAAAPTAEQTKSMSTQPLPPPPTSKSSISKTPFGRVDGRDVDLYTLTNTKGLTAEVMTYGGILTRLLVPDRSGKMADVVLGFDTLDGYLKGNPYFGATVGRVGNRIRDARFHLGTKTYTLAANNKPHHLHGGVKGWDKVVWTAEPRETADGPSLRLTYVSKDGEEGYPGTVTATCTYTLTNANELRIEMAATTDATTLVNMVHHTYWNLAGQGSGPITSQVLTLHADAYTPGDPMVPTGKIEPVKGTPFDFTHGKPIGRDLQAAGGDPVGYDHNFVVNGKPDQLRPVATLADPASGRVLTLLADQPGVQFYSGNFLDGTTIGKGGHAYAQHTGLCLETQKFPNAINVKAWRDQDILQPGRTYSHVMIHRFTVE
jgi:aldose 1-epimerase